MGTINVLGLAKRVKARVLQASTSEIYGDPQVHPQTEDYWGHVNPVGVRSCYDEGKRCAETLCFDYHRQNQVDIKVARIFNTYGPNMDLNDGRVVSNFITQSLNGKALTVFGDGSHTRSFCYVDDIVEGLITLMNTPPEITGPVNLGNPEEITIMALAKRIIELSKSTAEVEHLGHSPDDPARRQPDIELARRLLNWEPKVTLDVGLEKTIAYFSTLLALSSES
jgi:UDP-glucuronate decarboxylase